MTNILRDRLTQKKLSVQDISNAMPCNIRPFDHVFPSTTPPAGEYGQLDHNTSVSSAPMMNFENAYKDLSTPDNDLYIQGKNKFVSEIQHAKSINGKVRRLVDKRYISWMEGELEPPEEEEVIEEHTERGKTYLIWKKWNLIYLYI